jgi:hypothetical protein
MTDTTSSAGAASSWHACTAFGLTEMAVGLASRSEFGTVFDRDVVDGRRASLAATGR